METPKKKSSEKFVKDLVFRILHSNSLIIFTNYTFYYQDYKIGLTIFTITILNI